MRPMTKHNTVKRLTILLAACVLALHASPAAADDAAEAYVQRVLDEAEPILGVKPMMRRFFDGLADLVDKYVDMRRVGLFTLGQYARQMTAEQKEEYLPLFKKYATQIYQNSLSNYSGQKTGREEFSRSLRARHHCEFKNCRRTTWGFLSPILPYIGASIVVAKER